MKRINKYLIAIFSFLVLANFSLAQIGGMTLWYLDGTTLKPVDSTWSVDYGVVGVSSGGTNTTSTTKGAILVGSSTAAYYAMATGTEGYVLTISSGMPAWAVAAASGVSSLNTLTGALTLWGTSPLTLTASSTNGLLLAVANVATTGSALSVFSGSLTMASTTGSLTLSRTDVVTGRSLSTSTAGQIDIDSEIYTKISTFAIRNATSTLNPVIQHKYPTAITITRISCSGSQLTTTIQFDERSEATPNTAGTDVLSAALGCGSSTTSASTAFANAGIAANAILSLDIDAMTGGSTTTVNIHVEYTIDD